MLYGEGVEEGLGERSVCGRLAVEVQHAVDVVVLVLEDARLVRLGVRLRLRLRLGVRLQLRGRVRGRGGLGLLG